MPADPLQHVSPGTPLMEAVTAEVLNALKDAARDVRGERLPGPSGGASSKDLVGSLTVLIRNDTGGDLASGSILKITGKIGDVVNAPIPFRKRPILTGDVPDDPSNAIAILHEPILTGGFGRAAIAGVCVCYVSINDVGHEYASPIVGDETALESVAFGGPARIIWKESSGAVRVAAVILGDVAAGLDLIDISGRSGSVADVTALQILRGVISGTPGAAVFTPDDASASLPGIVSTGAQTIAGDKSLNDSLIVNLLKTAGALLRVWGTGATDPVLVTSDAGVTIGGSTNLADLECFGSATLSDEAIANARSGNYTSSDGALRVKSSETNRDTLRIVPRAKASGSLAYLFEEALEAAAVRGVFTIYGNVSAVEIVTATNGAGVSAGSISMETALVSAFSLPCVHAVPITGSNDLWIIFDAANNRFNFYTDDASPKLSMKGVDGVTGTGGGGDGFTGGVCTFLGSGPSGSAGGDLGGTYPNPTVAQASGSFAFTGDISPAQLVANTNDWSPTGWN